MQDQPGSGRWPRRAAAVGLLLLLATLWLSATDEPRIWLLRNTVEYRAQHWLWSVTDEPARVGSGRLALRVRDRDGVPLEGARLLVARWDGETVVGRSDAAGRIELEGLPAGRYQPVVGRAGYQAQQLGGRYGGVQIDDGGSIELEAWLAPLPEPPTVVAGGYERVDEQFLSCRDPVEATARRETVRLEGDDELVYYYSPQTSEAAVPVLLAVYPSPVETWECVTVPLAAAGYAVLALSPAYSLDLERDVDGLERLVAIAREGGLPGGDPERVAALGGSYSALLVLRLLERDPTLDAGVLLGAPTDLFDMRRRFEREGFVPPFDLDRLLVGLGFPDRQPLRYWRYSGAYHVSPESPPMAIFHSTSDEIVPHQQSELLAEMLAQEGVEHELHLVDGATHYLLSGDEDALQIYDLTLDFLARQLR